jgi:ABC-2 type transport system permease protein
VSIVERPIALVARREVSEGFRSRGFWILLAVSVVAVAAIITIANLAGGSSESRVDLAVVSDPDPAAVDRYEAIGTAIGTSIDVSSVADDAAARAAVESGDADVALLDGATTIVVEEPIDADDTSDVATVVNVLRSDIALTQGLTEAGMSQQEIAAALSHDPPAVESLDGGETGDDNGGRLATAIIINIALFLLLQTYGGWVVSGVTREKASRVVEVLLSTLTARQLMFGKILGIGTLALMHAATLVTTAIAAAAIVGIDVPDGFRAVDILVGAAWFVLGYALYCSAFAAAGSLCSRAEDAQGAVLPIMLPLIAGYIIAFSAADGASTLLWVLAFFPPTAVLCMPVLYATGEAAVWAMLLSMAITAVSAYAVARLAAAIYSRSILKAGKRVSWREAVGRGSARSDVATAA